MWYELERILKESGVEIGMLLISTSNSCHVDLHIRQKTSLSRFLWAMQLDDIPISRAQIESSLST